MSVETGHHNGNPASPGRFRHPNESAKNRLVYRTFETALRGAAERYARGRLIDVGGGRKPWQPIFAAYVSEHVCVDHVEKDDDRGQVVDVIATAYSIPLPDAQAQTILLTEVLEHLERPGDAVAECLRLLEPGGHLIATTPLFWPVHDPRDFYRYTPQGLRYLLETVPLGIVGWSDPRVGRRRGFLHVCLGVGFSGLAWLPGQGDSPRA